MLDKTKSLVAEKDEWGSVVEPIMTALLFGVMLLVVIPMLPVVQSAQKYFASQSYEGNVETRVLNATGTLQWLDFTNICPYLISAFFINRGTNKVYIGINEAKDWLEIFPGETRTVSHVGAEKRIVIIFYKCDTAKTTTVELEGHY